VKGLVFAHIARDQQVEGRFNIRTGIVKAAVGNSHWLLEFKGKAFKFANVLSCDDLASFQFFNTEAELQAFVAEIISANQPEPPVTPEASLPSNAVQ
jgi:hypothetical protein